ncbi:MAG: sigma-70 family RNA polymerase sigma factor [Rubripirellula sp.]
MTSNKYQNEHDERDAFVRLLMRHDRAIRAFLRSLLPSNNDVDDLMQEASVVAWRKFGELDSHDNFGRWLIGIARFEVLMLRRKKTRDRHVLTEEIEALIANEGVEELDLRQQQLMAVEDCVEKLPTDRKELVRRVYAAEDSMKAIASDIGKTPEAIYKLMSRLRQQLLGCIENSLSEARQ